MSKRAFFILLGTLSLIIGGAIYLLFRENAYITIFFGTNFLARIRETVSFLSVQIVNFYFVDFLWGLSLCAYLLAIFAPKGAGIFFCGIVAFLCGTGWELLQFTGVVSGTGDVLDIIAYLVAAIIAVIIFLKGKFL